MRCVPSLDALGEAEKLAVLDLKMMFSSLSIITSSTIG
jgi:hypothetical protein